MVSHQIVVSEHVIEFHLLFGFRLENHITQLLTDWFETKGTFQSEEIISSFDNL